MLSQPHVQITLLQALLVTGTPERLARLLSAPRPERPAADLPRRASKTWACFSSPHWPSGCMPLHSAQLSPGSGWDPTPSWECALTKLAPAVAIRGAEELTTQRRLPFHKRQQMTPQKKTSFPSVSLQMNGRWGPSCRASPHHQNGPISARELRARCKQLPSAGRPSNVCFACWSSV